MKLAVARDGAAAFEKRGAECGGSRPGAWSLEPGPGPQPAPGEVSAGPSRPPRGLLLADRAGGAPGGRLTRAGRLGVPPSGLGGPETRAAGALEPRGPLGDLGELRQTCQRSGGLESRWDRGKLGHRSHHTFPFSRIANSLPPTRFRKMEVEWMQSASPELRGERGAPSLPFFPIRSLLFPAWLRSSCSSAFCRFQTRCTWAPLRCSPWPWQLPSRSQVGKQLGQDAASSPRPAHVKTAR